MNISCTTSSQSECMSNNINTNENDTVTKEMADKSEESSGVDSGCESKSKGSLGRFAKRNYRKRSDSQSSKDSTPMEASSSTQQKNDANQSNPNEKNQEVS